MNISFESHLYQSPGGSQGSIFVPNGHHGRQGLMMEYCELSIQASNSSNPLVSNRLASKEVMGTAHSNAIVS